MAFTRKKKLHSFKWMEKKKETWHWGKLSLNLKKNKGKDYIIKMTVDHILFSQLHPS